MPRSHQVAIFLRTTTDGQADHFTPLRMRTGKKLYKADTHGKTDDKYIIVLVDQEPTCAIIVLLFVFIV